MGLQVQRPNWPPQLRDNYGSSLLDGMKMIETVQEICADASRLENPQEPSPDRSGWPMKLSVKGGSLVSRPGYPKILVKAVAEFAEKIFEDLPPNLSLSQQQYRALVLVGYSEQQVADACNSYNISRGTLWGKLQEIGTIFHNQLGQNEKPQKELPPVLVQFEYQDPLPNFSDSEDRRVSGLGPLSCVLREKTPPPNGALFLYPSDWDFTDAPVKGSLEQRSVSPDAKGPIDPEFSKKQSELVGAKAALDLQESVIIKIASNLRSLANGILKGDKKDLDLLKGQLERESIGGSTQYKDFSARIKEAVSLCKLNQELFSLREPCLFSPEKLNHLRGLGFSVERLKALHLEWQSFDINMRNMGFSLKSAPDALACLGDALHFARFVLARINGETSAPYWWWSRFNYFIPPDQITEENKPENQTSQRSWWGYFYGKKTV